MKYNNFICTLKQLIIGALAPIINCFSHIITSFSDNRTRRLSLKLIVTKTLDQIHSMLLPVAIT